jgi:DNA polymerase (family 10)
MEGAPFKPQAYEKAANVIDGLEEKVELVYQKGGIKALEDIPGVGVSMAEKIEEIIKTGKMKYYEELKKKYPINLDELGAIEGLGPKSLFKLYKKLGVKNLKDLEVVAKSGKISRLENFGEKSEENILKGIAFAKKGSGRFVLGFIMPEIRAIVSRLQKLKEVERLEVAGSTRRMKETIGDVDILIISKKPKPVMDYFVSMPEVSQIHAKGQTKSSVKLDNGLDVDLRVVSEGSYGSALAYFTGSKDHNIALREIAIKKGLKLNEYGLWREEKRVAGKTEEEIYKALGLDYIEPEMRENTGEIEAARGHKLPELISYGDILGDLQVQTDWSDGENSIEEMARVAVKRGLKYIAITDHTHSLAIAHGLDDKTIQKQWIEIDKIQKKFGNQIKILKGTECDILRDGSLDLSDKTLSKLDVVGVSVHSYFNLSREEQTERIKKAMRNSNVDIIFHPTGRIIKKREPYDVDVQELLREAVKTKTIMEIDAFPDRLDLKDEYIKKGIELGVKFSIDSDSHSLAHFSFLEYGVAQARRGWAEKSDIINVWPLDKMLKLLKSK